LSSPILLERVADLLDGLQSHHREVVRALRGGYTTDAADALIAEIGNQGRSLAARLRDRALTQLMWVTLPEPMVLPMKLFTMFSSIDKAVADVRARRATVDRAMRRIAGCEEWGIRVTRPSAAHATPRRPDRASNSHAIAKDGTAFLVARRNARDAARRVRAEALAAADAAFERLQRLARDARRRDRRPEGGSNPSLLDAAFLVASGSRARFRAEVRRLSVACASAGAELTLTGPWPAYNFVDAAGDRS
jgi:hypothetical protein